MATISNLAGALSPPAESPPPPAESTAQHIERWCNELFEARDRQRKAAAHVAEIEALLVNALGAPGTGQKTHVVGAFKITLKQLAALSVDQEKAPGVAAELAERGLPPVVVEKTSWAVSAGELRKLEAVAPNFCREHVYPAITEKMGKVSVEVKA